MTVVVVTDKVLVVDSAVTTGKGYYMGGMKKWAIHGNKLMTGVGRASAINDILLQFENSGAVTRIPADIQEEMLLWDDRGRLSILDTVGTFYAIDAKMYATGSGGALALGALHAGASPSQAAKIACQIDFRCRGPLYSFAWNGRFGKFVQTEIEI